MIDKVLIRPSITVTCHQLFLTALEFMWIWKMWRFRIQVSMWMCKISWWNRKVSWSDINLKLRVQLVWYNWDMCQIYHNAIWKCSLIWTGQAHDWTTEQVIIVNKGKTRHYLDQSTCINFLHGLISEYGPTEMWPVIVCSVIVLSI